MDKPKNNNGKNGIIVRYSIVGGLILIGIGVLVISGFAKKVYHAAEIMPQIEHRLAIDSVINYNQDTSIKELTDMIKEMQYKVNDLWRNQVPPYQRRETELILRGGDAEGDE